MPPVFKDLGNRVVECNQCRVFGSCYGEKFRTSGVEE